VLRARDRAVRNLIASLAFSQGVPMLSHGDELGRSQQGNNNAYCQDGELTWIDWNLGERERLLLDFVRQVFAIRRSTAVFRRRRCFSGDPVCGEQAKDVMWLRPDGHEMQAPDWEEGKNRVLGMLIHGESADEVDERGRPQQGETLLLLLNGGHTSRYFHLPLGASGAPWHELVNTAHPAMRDVRGDGVNLIPHSLILLSSGRS
jgi:isoamylase